MPRGPIYPTPSAIVPLHSNISVAAVFQTRHSPSWYNMQDEDMKVLELRDDGPDSKSANYAETFDKTSPAIRPDATYHESSKSWPVLDRITHFLMSYGIETNGYVYLILTFLIPSVHFLGRHKPN